ncbi:hypothetical protein SAMN02745121_08900 [Nannocystis exedens]|uniref:Uncharacterized protein n=1 Tax=Nannocystis exedens TaxID=54 RepID=A0A1I2IS95_9BACT|nr:hypothetical protein [Nannocystis exedens]PCC69277.1 hypothetical protein NAEX_02299 [Nannocystis exedens]SFF44518.1 hypothetical protein SAMN02745121_08900 [Nannocystis exedens]
MTLTWTPATRRKLHGARNHLPDDPETDDPETAPPYVAWEILATSWSIRTKEETQIGNRVLRPTAFRAEREPLRSRLAAVLEELERDDPPEDLDVIKELLRAFVLERTRTDNRRESLQTWRVGRGSGLVDLWAGTKGLAFCLDVLTSPGQFTALDTDDDSGGILFDLVEPIEGDTWELYTGADTVTDPFWWALRAWVSGLSEDAFARQLAEARPLLARLRDRSPGVRARVAFALSRDPSIAEELKADLMREEVEGTGDAVVWLYPSLRDAKSVLEFIDAIFGTEPPWPALWLSFDVVEAYGAEAAELLRRTVGHRPADFEVDDRAALAFLEQQGR